MRMPVRAGGRVGGDAGGSEAAFSSMASDRASGIRRRHSTKVVARLSFGRAAPTRAQLIPFVSRCYGSIPAWAMRGRFDVLMAQGKRAATWLATIDGRQGRARILSEAAPIHGRGRSVCEERFNFEMAPPGEATRQRRRSPAGANRLISVRRDGDDSLLAA
jgi:hypothetical protein